MEKENEVQTLYKVRNVMSCMSEGFTLLAKNLLLLVKYLWPTLVLIALIAALITTFCSQLMVPASLGNSSALVKVLLLTGILVILYIIFAVFFGGQVFTYMQKFSELGYFPQASFKVLWKPIRHNAWRYFLASLLIAVSFTLLSVLFSLVTILTGVMAKPILGVVLNLLFAIVVCLLLLPFLYMLISYMMDVKPLRQVFGAGLKQGFKSFGAIFVIMLVGGIFILIIQAIGNMPNSILILSRYNSLMALAQGDPSDLPATFGILQFLFSFLGKLIDLLSGLGILFSLMFLYGSIVTRKRDKERYEAEQRALQEQ